MSSPIIKTDVNLLSKVKSLVASFFQKFVTTKNMNKVITNMNNVGIVDMVVCVTADTTTDFTMLKAGDYVLNITNGTNAKYEVVATDGTLPSPGVATNLYIVIRPSA